MILNGFTDSFTQYDARNGVVCLVAVQGLAEENEQGINENTHKKKQKCLIPVFFFFCESCLELSLTVCFLGKVQENHFPDIRLYNKPITWHPVVRLYCIGSLYGCKELMLNTLYVIYCLNFNESMLT